MRTDAVRFLLDDEVVELRDVPPTRTVLEYLREDLGRTGTREGCAEGDCGACTVAVVEADASGGLRTRAVNACIQFLPTLHGKQLLTVESLGKPGSLHPVQAALVEQHASQCGFCTPGFAMSLFALYKHNAAPTRDDINVALSGNLCRCTGYGPIVDAASAMYEPRLSDPARANTWHARARRRACGRRRGPRRCAARAERLAGRPEPRWPERPVSRTDRPWRGPGRAARSDALRPPAGRRHRRRAVGDEAVSRARPRDLPRKGRSTRRQPRHRQPRRDRRRRDLQRAPCRCCSNTSPRWASCCDAWPHRQIRNAAHARRQHRQRLAHRRFDAGGADRARREHRSCAMALPLRPGNAALEDFFHRLRPQDRARAGRVSS